MERLVGMMRAAGDPTRLRLLLLLMDAELTVSELTQILGQSQPRVSRHLKLLCEAGLLERFKEGTWVFYRACDVDTGGAIAREIARLAGETQDATLAADRRRLEAVRAARAAAASAYFKANAPQWERLRSLHVPEPEVEAAITRLLGASQIDTLLDAGTGTGRMLELLAPHVRRGIGVDVSPEMLAIARDRLERAEIGNCHVRLADAYRLPFPDGGRGQGFDAVLFHQVLHYLDDPAAAVREAARVLKADGRIVVVDFAPHELEFLRTGHAHRRLGFADREVRSWFHAAGLMPVSNEALSPRAGGEQLTVMIWLARASQGAVRATTAEAAA